jgi:very-short-patch-repair endonuclease
MPTKIPKAPSELEARFMISLRACDLQCLFKTEYQFHPKRRWRFDFADPQRLIAVELEGGIWSKKRTGHSSGAGIKQDMEKSNEAQKLGWRVFRFDIKDVMSGHAINFILDILEQEKD